MDTLLIIMSLFILAGLGGLAALVLRLLAASRTTGENATELRILREQLDSLRRDMADQGSRSQQGLEQRLDGIRSRIDEQMGRMGSTLTDTLAKNNTMLTQGLSATSQHLQGLKHEMGAISGIPGQLRELTGIFQRTKARGIAGEVVIENLLGQVLPAGTWATQVEIDKDTRHIVDVAITVAEGRIIPIDCKFPKDNFEKVVAAANAEERAAALHVFRKDVKKHLSDVASKYIRPEKGTLDYAIMFIPSEAMYYEVLLDTELITELQRQRVLAASPNTLYYFLQLILVGFRGMQVERHAAQILADLRAMHQQAGKVEKAMDLAIKQSRLSADNLAETRDAFLQLTGLIRQADQRGNDVAHLSPLPDEGALPADTVPARPVSAAVPVSNTPTLL